MLTFPCNLNTPSKNQQTRNTDYLYLRFLHVFQALGNGVFSLIVSVCRQLFVLLPAAWLLAQTGSVNNVWWAFLIAEVVSILMSLAFYARINKTTIAPLYH